MLKSILMAAFTLLSVATFAQKYTPDWAQNATIYEVNVRQFSKDGNFAGVAKQLPRLKAMGVDILWLMPINPIGEKNRKGSLGSYYAVKDYQGVNREFGNLDDFKNLVNQAHALGMYVIIDWVANHSSPDNVWIQEGHLDWYTLDSTGNVQPTIGTDWWDVADLNYDNMAMRVEMIKSMKYWLTEANIDGFRCDVAGWVPLDFWMEARAELQTVKPIFMLAEAEEIPLHDAFEMTYGWEFHHVMNDVAKGKKDATAIRSFMENNKYPGTAYRMNFTSNHDENSWNGTEMERMGDARFAMAVLAGTIDGMPLVYNGQETSLDRRLKFFDKDSIEWKKMDLVPFYTKLLNLHQTNEALWVRDGSNRAQFITTPNPKEQLVFVRESNGHQVITILNLSNKKAEFSFTSKNISGSYTDLFSGKKKSLTNTTTVSLGAWGYQVFYK
ncbi:MAG: alpha-amylase family glycosyl hydrolase [Flavobacteriales bacterium]